MCRCDGHSAWLGVGHLEDFQGLVGIASTKIALVRDALVGSGSVEDPFERISQVDLDPAQVSFGGFHEKVRCVKRVHTHLQLRHMVLYSLSLVSFPMVFRNELVVRDRMTVAVTQRMHQAGAWGQTPAQVGVFPVVVKQIKAWLEEIPGS